ncbi:MAG: Ppx/GppA phosphatase family protein [Chloroflexota bacterium]|nr:MAG: Ppx/GppA family phosphatase [Chloroflexota bacterium]
MEAENDLINLKRLKTLAEHSDVYRDSQRLAIIDMGSNSFRLIVVEYVPQLSFKVTDEVREAVRLSEGMAANDVMSAAAMDRAARVMRIYAAFCAASGINDIVAVGTSAIREARNRAYFLKRIVSESNIPVRVLEGEEEAYYAYLAAVNSTTLTDGFVLDLGGGSMEIIRVKNRRNANAISLPLGAVRVTERFLHSDPVTSKEVKKLQSHLRDVYQNIDWFQAEPGMMLVGEGGTLRLIARLIQKQKHYPLDHLHGYVMTLDEVDAVVDKLASLSVAERNKLAGMKHDRADISLAGAIVVAEAMRASGAKSMTICSQSMREGLFYERFLAGSGAPVFHNVRHAAVLNLAHLYRFQEQHAEHIARLTLSMFDQLPPETHDCGPVERELLWAASMLHDIGVSVDYHDHHKHSAYLILNGGLPGYTHREIALIALMARYHRKGKPTVDEFASLLKPGDDRRLLQLCALLRLAEQLDRSRDGVVRDLSLRVVGGHALMEINFRGDEQVALWALERHTDIFEQAFGLKLQVIPIPVETTADDALA